MFAEIIENHTVRLLMFKDIPGQIKQVVIPVKEILKQHSPAKPQQQIDRQTLQTIPAHHLIRLAEMPAPDQRPADAVSLIPRQLVLVKTQKV